jgi:hypothetical protein
LQIAVNPPLPFFGHDEASRKATQGRIGMFRLLTARQGLPFFRKFAAERSGYIEERMAAADHADIVRATADDISFRAKHSILQGDSIQNPRLVQRAFNT